MNSMIDSIKPGLVFLHRRHVTQDGKPERYKVTKVTQNTVYYRAINEQGEYIGTPWKAPMSIFVHQSLGNIL